MAIQLTPPFRLTKPTEDYLAGADDIEYTTGVSIKDKLDNVGTEVFKIVKELPTDVSEVNENKIYLVPKTKGSTNNSYNEYKAFINDTTITWELIGSAQTDVSGYITEADANGKYLRKDQADSTNYSLTIGKDLTVKAETALQDLVTLSDDLKSNNYTDGGLSTGAGWKIDQNGNGEFESLKVRSALTVLELVYNRLSAEESEYVFTESGTIESIEENSDGTYTCHIKKRNDSDFHAFREQDILRGVVNDLDNLGEGKYTTTWLKVTDTDTANNTITVSLYDDDYTPAQKNYAPEQYMVLQRWGNTVVPSEEAHNNEKYSTFIEKNGDTWVNTRQSCFYISSSEKRIAMLDGVNQPILTESNYAAFFGLPNDLTSFKQHTLDPYLPYLYVKGAFLQDIYRIDYKGNVIKEERYRGIWDSATASGDDPYIVTETTYDTVYYGKAKYQCNGKVGVAVTEKPSDTSTYWTKLLEVKDGDSLTIKGAAVAVCQGVIESEKVFDEGNVLICDYDDEIEKDGKTYHDCVLTADGVTAYQNLIKDEANITIPEENDIYSVNGTLYKYSPSEDVYHWLDIGGIKGEKGDTGDNGENAVQFELVTSADSIIWTYNAEKQDWDMSPSTDITISLYKISGSERSELTFDEDDCNFTDGTDVYYLQYSKDNGEWKSKTTNVIKTKVAETVDSSYKLRLTDTDKETIYCTKEIPVIADGDPGEDAKILTLSANKTVVACDNNYNPTSTDDVVITAKLVNISGTTEWQLEDSDGNKLGSNYYSISDNVCRLNVSALAGEDNTIVTITASCTYDGSTYEDELVIGRVCNGAPGESIAGKDAKPLRGPLKWTVGTKYQGGATTDDYQDIVYVDGINEMYLCHYTHVASEDNRPDEDSHQSTSDWSADKPWSASDWVDFTATSVLFATTSKINNLQVDNVKILDNDGNNKVIMNSDEIYIDATIVTPSKQYDSEQESPIIIDVNENRSVTINGDCTKRMVILPLYNEYNMINGTKIPSYQQSGAHIYINVQSVAKLSNWRYFSDTKYQQIWEIESPDTDVQLGLNRQLLNGYFQDGAVLVCADALQLYAYKTNYNYEHELNGADPSNPQKHTYLHGRFNINGATARFILLMPGQTLSLRSAVETYIDDTFSDEEEGYKTTYLVWYVENGENLVNLHHRMDVGNGFLDFEAEPSKIDQTDDPSQHVDDWQDMLFGPKVFNADMYINNTVKLADTPHLQITRCGTADGSDPEFSINCNTLE